MHVISVSVRLCTCMESCYWSLIRRWRGRWEKGCWCPTTDTGKTSIFGMFFFYSSHLKADGLSHQMDKHVQVLLNEHIKHYFSFPQRCPLLGRLQPGRHLQAIAQHGILQSPGSQTATQLPRELLPESSHKHHLHQYGDRPPPLWRHLQPGKTVVWFKLRELGAPRESSEKNGVKK